MTTPDPHRPAPPATRSPPARQYSSPSATSGHRSRRSGAARRPRPAVRAPRRPTADAAAPPAPRRRHRPRGTPAGRSAAPWPRALLVFVTVVLVLFVVFNTQTVDISLVFTDVEARWSSPC